MLIWSASFVCASIGLRLLLGGVAPSSLVPSLARERETLRAVHDLLQELEDTLGAGLVIEASRWAALRALPAPWGGLAAGSLEELRSRGGALLPTMRRLKALAADHAAALLDARARSSQALAQAVVCAGLVPAFGGALYFLLPALEERAVSWCLACAGALALAGAGSLWMLRLAEGARWGGLAAGDRPWVLASQCAGERFLALVRAGSPPDLAWARAGSLLEAEAPGLAAAWGLSVWGEGKPASTGPRRPLEEAGHALRKAVQVSLMEGRPCVERVETALQVLRQELRSAVERELQLLGTRALKPLFACVAPSLFGLLGCGMWISWVGMGA